MLSLVCSWNEKMTFTATAEQHEVKMDAKSPIGNGSAMTPKALLLAAISGCTAMDVIALLKKFQQAVDEFHIEADANLVEANHPFIFSKVTLTFKIKGIVNPEKAIEAVRLSQTKYCSVSAMVSKAVPIFYNIEVNGNNVGSGQSNFDIEEDR